MDWTTIGIAILSGVLSSGIFGLIIKYYFDIKFEQERVRFSKLHEKRADIIANLYSELTDIENKLDQLLLSPTGLRSFVRHFSKEERARDMGSISESKDQFFFRYKKNRIYFSKNINLLLDNLFINFQRCEIMTISGELSTKDEVRAERLEKAKEILLIIKSIKEELESEFREILGVKD